MTVIRHFIQMQNEMKRDHPPDTRGALKSIIEGRRFLIVGKDPPESGYVSEVLHDQSDTTRLYLMPLLRAAFEFADMKDQFQWDCFDRINACQVLTKTPTESDFTVWPSHRYRLIITLGAHAYKYALCFSGEIQKPQDLVDAWDGSPYTVRQLRDVLENALSEDSRLLPLLHWGLLMRKGGSRSGYVRSYIDWAARHVGAAIKRTVDV